jgi:glycine C-acetyltransferase
MFSFRETLKNEIKELKDNGLFKNERVITSDQQTTIRTETTGEVINFCANNYLGLANDPRIIDAAKKTMDTHGFGLASVRFICGTQDIHKQLERTISEFLGKEDTILYAAAFDANGGLFEPLFTEEDALISDELNHASIIDGIRLCKAQRFRYKHNNMEDLEAKLQEASKARRRIVITDGAFSMDGTVAQMDKICALAQKYDALVMTDECHSMGFMGKTGRGVPEHCGVLDQVDIITGTLGKALGGGSGGFTSGPKEIIDLLRQRSRPYLFSNTLAPAIVGASLEVFNIIGKTTELRDQLEANTEHFRKKITEAGFDIKPGNHPIVPIMLYDAALAQKMAEKLLAEGIYVIGFYYPVVAKGQARIRVQISAKHTSEQLNKAIDAFTKIGKELGVIK